MRRKQLFAEFSGGQNDFKLLILMFFFALFNAIFLALSLLEHLPLAREFFRIKPWKKILITAKFSQ